MVQSQYSGGRQLIGAQRERSGRAGLLYPLLDPKASPVPGLTMSIRQVFGLHKIRLQNLKAHIHLSQQHHQIDLRARNNQLTLTEQPWIWTSGPSLTPTAPRWLYLEGRWDIQQVFKGQGAASRKMRGTEVLHQLEVVETVCHRHGVLEAHLCGDRIYGSPTQCKGRWEFQGSPPLSQVLYLL